MHFITRTKRAFIAVFMSMGFVLLACSTSQQPETGNRLIIGTQFDIGGSMDPRMGLGGPSLAPKLLVFETPVYFDENYVMKPLLLTAWRHAPDCQEWVFTLRRGVRFSDGTPFDAHALIFSIRYMSSSGSAYANIASMDALDPHTVRVRLKKPDAVFLHRISTLPVMSPGCVDDQGRFVKPIGTGPFKFVEYTEAKQLVYTKNHDYWGEPAKVQDLIIKIIPDANTRAMALESGEVDVADYLPAVILKRLEENPRFAVVRDIPSACVNWIGMNTRRPPLDDVRVRRAINHAVDVKSIVDSLINSILPGFAIPALKGPHSQKLYEHLVDPDLQWPSYDFTRARHLLLEAGWKDTDGDGILEKNGEPFHISLISTALYPEGPKIGEALQSQLKSVGIKLGIEIMESGARFKAYREKKYDMIELAGICPYNDPTTWYEYYFHSTKNPAYCILEDPQIDAAIDSLSTTATLTSRIEIFRQLQRLLAQKAPGIFIYTRHEALAFRAEVKGFRIACGLPGVYFYARNAYK